MILIFFFFFAVDYFVSVR